MNKNKRCHHWNYLHHFQPYRVHLSLYISHRYVRHHFQLKLDTVEISSDGSPGPRLICLDVLRKEEWRKRVHEYNFKMIVKSNKEYPSQIVFRFKKMECFDFEGMFDKFYTWFQWFNWKSSRYPISLSGVVYSIFPGCFPYRQFFILTSETAFINVSYIRILFIF